MSKVITQKSSARGDNISNVDIKEIFDYFDRNKDGFLELKDLGVALRSYGLCPSQSELKQLENELGSKINADAFRNAVRRFESKGKNSQEEIREALRIFDRESSGKVDMFEIKHAMTTMGEPLRDEEVDELIREIDIDADGKCFLEDISIIISYYHCDNMAKKRTRRKAPAKRKLLTPLDTVFTCPFCQYEKACEVTINRRRRTAEIICKICNEEYRTNSTELSAPIDIYNDWIDACEEVNKS
ncbi:hypothetical protein GJ496_003519 [Pomphorhynchus laevis]|nr:hypothetical protein GJ496_003519 [Pomphorhynchus laevis]